MPPRHVRSLSGASIGNRSRISKLTSSRETSRTSRIRGFCLESLLEDSQESSQAESTISSFSAETRTNVSQKVMVPLPLDIADPVFGLMKNTLKGSIVDMTQLPNEVTQGLPIDVTRAFLSPADWKVFLEVSGRVSRFGNCSSLSCTAASTAIDRRASSGCEHTALE